MTVIDALIELLERVGACQDTAVLINDEDLRQWPESADKAMKSQKLIVKTRPASSVICSGCEDSCVMPVHTLPATTRKTSPFILCDKRSDVNRMPVLPERLIQWQCNVDLVCRFIASSLGLRSPARKADSNSRREIGIVKGDKRSQMLCLEASGTLTLVAGSSKIPLAEFIGFREGTYILDAAQIRQLADSSITTDDRYTPNKAKIEARKLDTQAMYESWQKEYRAMRREKTGMSDVWYSLQIAKMPVAKGRDAETIRKHMKK